MIDLTINKTGLQHNIEKAKENHVIIPTIAQMQNPDLIPEKVKACLLYTSSLPASMRSTIALAVSVTSCSCSAAVLPRALPPRAMTMRLDMGCDTSCHGL